MASITNSNSSPKISVCLENMEEVDRVFKRFDANSDGKISSAELGDVLRALGTDVSPEELKRMMEEIDLDGDGFIDLKEFADFHRGVDKGDANGGETGSTELKDAFDMYDKDKNGLISASELHMVLRSLGEKCSLQDCARMISSVDSDRDGNVNFAEFKKMMTNNKAVSQ